MPQRHKSLSWFLWGGKEHLWYDVQSGNSMQTSLWCANIPTSRNCRCEAHCLHKPLPAVLSHFRFSVSQETRDKTSTGFPSFSKFNHCHLPNSCFSHQKNMDSCPLGVSYHRTFKKSIGFSFRCCTPLAPCRVLVVVLELFPGVRLAILPARARCETCCWSMIKIITMLTLAITITVWFNHSTSKLKYRSKSK